MASTCTRIGVCAKRGAAESRISRVRCIFSDCNVVCPAGRRHSLPRVAPIRPPVRQVYTCLYDASPQIPGIHLRFRPGRIVVSQRGRRPPAARRGRRRLLGQSARPVHAGPRQGLLQQRHHRRHAARGVRKNRGPPAQNGRGRRRLGLSRRELDRGLRRSHVPARQAGRAVESPAKRKSRSPKMSPAQTAMWPTAWSSKRASKSS